MVGDVVGGYVVKEALASGRSGLLFLAIHPETGHRAVVQRRLGEDDLRSFGQEAAQVLGLAAAPHVERRRSRSGIAVLLAIVDAEAPGTGYTEYTNTERLPDLPPRAAPRRKLGGYVLGIGLVAVLGAALGAMLTSATSQQPVAQPPAPPQALALVAPSPGIAPRSPPAVDAGHGEGADGPVVAAPVAITSVKAAPVKPAAAPEPARPSYCGANPDSGEWKAHARADLGELMQRAAPHDALAAWADAEEKAIGKVIESPATRATCREVEQRLGRFHSRVLALEGGQ